MTSDHTEAIGSLADSDFRAGPPLPHHGPAIRRLGHPIGCPRWGERLGHGHAGRA